MKKLLSGLVLLSLFSCSSPKSDDNATLGLKEPVEIIRDEWGVNHIYAKNQHDLFFAQGYAAAKDRLFQFEIWRRQATGTVAEILGEDELKRDIGTRLFKFRGDMNKEMSHYHQDGVEIITAYTNGVNAYIDEIMANPEQLPLEFKVLDIVPGKWTPEVVISRHQGLLANIGKELEVGRAVAKIGVTKTKDLSWFHPKDPDINLDPAIDKDLLSADILGLYNAFRNPVKFKRDQIIEKYRTSDLNAFIPAKPEKEDMLSIGSNNWVVSGALTADGNAYMANDPHRTVSIPSLRYMTHLVAPGWNIIGGGEPEIPGISIGHNEFGTWGLTIFGTDTEDLYVYDLNPQNPKQYKYKGNWVDMKTIKEQIKIKGNADTTVELLYTQHGPVTYVDAEHHKAYAVRCGWLEVGGAPYLASLRFSQAKTWEEFREACKYSHIPGENMVWADKQGNIGWQSVGIAPIRKNFSGLVPVPGDGRYEWDGYLPILQKPNISNPQKGFFATANQNVTPQDYNHWDAIGFVWADPFRGNRANEVLSSGNKFTMKDMQNLQVDYLSIPARELTPLLSSIKLSGKSALAQSKLKAWDFKLEARSVEAAIYTSWENSIRDLAVSKFVPQEAKDIIKEIQLTRLIEWLKNPDSKFGANPVQGRNEFLTESFNNGIKYLEETLGSDMNKWQYGQEKLHHTYMLHPLGKIVNEETRKKLDLGPLPRGGNTHTLGSTSSNNRQSSGASFRMIVNTGDWDAAVSTNGPGQSGNPDSPFYSNLFKPWANDEYFPVYYSRSKIDSVSVEKTILNPKK